MQKIILLTLLASSIMAQRSPYAGNRNRTPLLSRYRPDVDSDLGNRVNVETTTSLPAELQGTLEDAALVQRVAEWPEEKQPYWFKNRHAIATNLQRPVDGNGQVNDRVTFPVREQNDNGQDMLNQRSYGDWFANQRYQWQPNYQQWPSQWSSSREYEQQQPGTTTWKPNKKYINLNRNEQVQ